MKVKVIDVTPTWRQILPMMIYAMRRIGTKPDADADKLVTEFQRMADAADKYNEIVSGKRKVKGRRR